LSSPAQTEYLKEFLSEMRYQFTVAALGASANQGDYAIVSSPSESAIFNGVFRLDKNISLAQVQVAVKNFKSQGKPGLFCLADNLTNFSEIANDFQAKSVQMLSEEYDLALDIEKFKIPFFIRKTGSLLRVDSPEALDRWIDLFLQNFEIPATEQKYFQSLIMEAQNNSHYKLHLYLGKQANKNVGTVAVLQKGEVGAVYGVSVDKKLRTMGTGTLMMASLITEGRSLGIRYMTGNSNKLGYQIYKKASSIISLGTTMVYGI
jgi:GNAT superfamily N-acetyltransferase